MEGNVEIMRVEREEWGERGRERELCKREKRERGGGEKERE